MQPIDILQEAEVLRVFIKTLPSPSVPLEVKQAMVTISHLGDEAFTAQNDASRGDRHE